MEIRINTLTAELLLDLYKSVGWEPPGIEQEKLPLNIHLQPSPVTTMTPIKAGPFA